MTKITDEHYILFMDDLEFLNYSVDIKIIDDMIIIKIPYCSHNNAKIGFENILKKVIKK